MLFCVTCLISAATGGNMFQAWNVGEITEVYFGIPSIFSGIVLSILVGAVIIGGIRRIGAVAGRLVPIMVLLYFLAAIYVLGINFREIPAMFGLIFRSAFSPLEATGAFLGGTMGYAFLFGMKRALFSNEAGQGTSPIAHSAAKTDEPVREGIVAGLEPFIDTLVVCTLTALVILSTGIWNRSAEATLSATSEVIEVEPGSWTLDGMTAPRRNGSDWLAGENVFVVVEGDENPQSGNNLHRLNGKIAAAESGELTIEWSTVSSASKPQLRSPELYVDYIGATLTAKAFDNVTPGLGKWLVTVAVWLFAFSTLISWSYYGEQSVLFIGGERAIMPYKLIYCALAIVATMDFIETSTELDNLTGFGTGVMLLVNVPIMWVFGSQAMRAYKEYVGRLKAGKIGPEHKPPSLEDLISGRDVEK